MRGFACLATVCLAVLVLSGCAPHVTQLCRPLELSYAGDLEAAVSAIDETALAGSERNRFLYYTQRGHLLHLAGDWTASNVEFERAARVAAELEPVSLTGTVSDYTINENVKAYTGEDFERAYVHYYMVLNYLMLGDREGALVECRRIDEVLRALDARYEEGTRRYQDDGFIRYVSGLIYEAEGKTDDARIDYELAVRAYDGEVGIGAEMDIPAELLESLNRCALPRPTAPSAPGGSTGVAQSAANMPVAPSALRVRRRRARSSSSSIRAGRPSRSRSRSRYRYTARSCLRSFAEARILRPL
ncbi:hypothetical protein K8S17_03175 [bacterium]|nr:hypothetical protein [bacterium]